MAVIPGVRARPATTSPESANRLQIRPASAPQMLWRLVTEPGGVQVVVVLDLSAQYDIDPGALAVP